MALGKISKEQVRALLGFYAGTLTIMSILIPVPILASVAQAFPDAPPILIQMLVSCSSFAAIAGSFVFARLARYVYRRTGMLIATSIYLLGLLPVAFHDSIYPALVAAVAVGFAMGGVQNTVGAMITDYFEGDSRGLLFGLCSLFVGIGGTVYTMTAAVLGAEKWWMAYCAYLIIAVILVFMFFVLPKGKKEEVAPGKTQRARVPREVVVVSVLVFFYFACNQVFSNNISMFINETGLGGTIESGNASSLYTIVGAISGLLVIPVHRLFKRQTLAVNAVLGAVGAVLIFTAGSLMPVFIGAALIAVAYAVFNSISSQYISEASDSVGMAFNLAILNSSGSLGNFFSPMLIGGVAGALGGTAGASFTVFAVLAVVVAIASAIYFAKYKSPKSTEGDVEVQMA